MDAKRTFFDLNSDCAHFFLDGFHGINTEYHLWDSSLPPSQETQGLLTIDASTNPSLGRSSPEDSSGHSAYKLHACILCSLDGRKSFKTINDLSRHMKSVHKKYKDGDRFWKCGVKGCPSAEKCWPRLDNFKFHVIKMHGLQYGTQIGGFAHVFKSEVDESSATTQISTYDTDSAHNRELIHATSNLDIMDLVPTEDWINSNVSPPHGTIGSAFDEVSEFTIPALVYNANGKVCHSQLPSGQFSSEIYPQAISAMPEYNNSSNLSLVGKHYYNTQQAQSHMFSPYSAVVLDYN